MLKRANDLHQLAIQLLENAKPGIYTTDPIPKPKFEKRKEDGFVLCPYCSTSRKSKNSNLFNIEYCYVDKKEICEHLASKEHVKEFVKHHMMHTATDDLISKMVYTLKNFI